MINQIMFHHQNLFDIFFFLLKIIKYHQHKLFHHYYPQWLIYKNKNMKKIILIDSNL